MKTAFSTAPLQNNHHHQSDAHKALTMHRDAVCPTLPEGDLWVFGYGSLMWNPGFTYTQRRRAQLYGYHRSLCVWSKVHRGTAEQPGMVLGLDQGGSCSGVAFLIAEKHKQAVVEYLYAREMPTTIYRAHLLKLRMEGLTEPQVGLTFTVDRTHPQYAGKVSAETSAQVIRHAQGISGPARDYLSNTLQHLNELGIADQRLSAIDALLK